MIDKQRDESPDPFKRNKSKKEDDMQVVMKSALIKDSSQVKQGGAVI